MFLQRIIRLGIFCAIIVTPMLALVPASFGESISNQEEEQDSSEEIEEIIVYSQKSLALLRHEVHIAEDQIFELFNSLNSDDEYDIHCYLQARPGGLFRSRVCKPNFVSRTESEAYGRMLLGRPIHVPSATITRKYKKLKEQMEALVTKRPEFLEALLKLADATDLVESERERRCRDRTFICRRQ